MDGEDDKKCCGDELIAGPELNGGMRPFVRHTADHQITAGLMGTAKEGQTVNGTELVQLTRIEGERYAVKSLYDDAPRQDRVGPSKIVSNKYRDGWDRIFGEKTVGQA